MTEYDYSPAAYERYLAQQARVSNWVDDTVQQSHAFANPFVLSPTHRDRSFYDEPDPGSLPHHYQHHPDQWSSSSRPSRERSRSYADHNHYDRAPHSRHRTQSYSRPAAAQRDVYPSQSYMYPQPHAAVARTPAPRTHTSPPHSYQYQAYVTQPPPGQIYQLPNAPAPVPKDTLYRHTSHSRHTSSKPPPQPYLLVQGGGPKAEYKRGVRLCFPSRASACADYALFIVSSRRYDDVSSHLRDNSASNTCACTGETTRPTTLAQASSRFRHQLPRWRSEREHAWAQRHHLLTLINPHKLALALDGLSALSSSF